VSVDCHIDLETRSAVDLRKTGVHVYAEDPTTDVWCACYAFDDGPIKTWMPGEPCPTEIVAHVLKGGRFWAHNAAFERTLWASVLHLRYGWPLPAPEQWDCTMARAYCMALPGSLDSASAALGINEAKDPAGYRTMLRMSKPRRYEEDGSPVWWDDPPRVAQLVAYCGQDVVVERALHARLMDLRPLERLIWLLDQKINDRGVYVDRALCEAAKPIIRDTLLKLNAEMRSVSKGFIPSCDAVAKIVEFCQHRGVDADSIRRDEVAELLSQELPSDVRRVLELRAEAGKAAVKKIDALLLGCSKDGRAKGLLAYHGASTGRWSARRFQPQNLKRPKDKSQESLIPIVMTGSASAVELLAGPPLEVVGDVIRGMITAAPGAMLFAADFASIESRVLAWLAGEQWKVKAFEEFDRGGGADMYRQTYARAFGVSVNSVNGDQRTIGKVLDLSLGFQGGQRALQSMAKIYGIEIEDDRADELKTAWRDAHQNIKQFWYDVEDAALRAVGNPGKTKHCDKLAFKTAGSFLFMRLPSGRAITYPYPKLKEIKTPWGSTKLSLTYKSVISPANTKRIVKDDLNSSNWARISTYGGSLVENATQAVARDVMAEAMLRVDAAGYPPVLTIHDEVVSERAGGSVAEFEDLMVQPPAWAGGLPIAAEAWSGPRYRK